MKSLLAVLFTTLLANLATSGEPAKQSVGRKKGLVPDTETAIAIAKAVWTPIYGRENIERQEPFNAHLRDGIWIVTGTLHTQLGGVARAEIAQADARVSRVTHGR